MAVAFKLALLERNLHRQIVVVVVTRVIRVLCEIVNVIANAVAALFNLVLTIPLLGPAIKALIWVFTTVLKLRRGSSGWSRPANWSQNHKTSASPCDSLE